MVSVYFGFMQLIEAQSLNRIEKADENVRLTTLCVYNFDQLRTAESSCTVEEDLVVLHALPRARTCPNVSPFGIKVNIRLRGG